VKKAAARKTGREDREFHEPLGLDLDREQRRIQSALNLEDYVSQGRS